MFFIEDNPHIIVSRSRLASIFFEKYNASAAVQLNQRESPSAGGYEPRLALSEEPASAANLRVQDHPACRRQSLDPTSRWLTFSINNDTLMYH